MVKKPNILKSKRSFFSKLDMERSVVGASLSLHLSFSSLCGFIDSWWWSRHNRYQFTLQGSKEGEGWWDWSLCRFLRMDKIIGGGMWGPSSVDSSPFLLHLLLLEKVLWFFCCPDYSLGFFFIFWRWTLSLAVGMNWRGPLVKFKLQKI